MISVQDLHFSYPCGKKVLNNIHFNLEKGSFLAVLGNNGVGKSTLIKCFNRILKPDQGKILMGDKNLLELPVKEIAKQVAFVAQFCPTTAMTVHDTVMLGRKPYMKWGVREKDHQIVHEAMDRLNIPHFMHGRYINELSGGERQKVFLARALAQEPDLLLLDEPTSNLDIKNQYEAIQLISNICHKDQISAIMVIHDINAALHFCDQFLFLKEGKLHSFGDSSIVCEESIKEVFDIKAKVLERNQKKFIVIDE